MTEEIFVKIYYALIDRDGNAHSISNRREAIEKQLEEVKASGAHPEDEDCPFLLCELVPWTTYEQIPLAQRNDYPPVTPITDAEPKFMAEGPTGPIECVPTIHARRMEHILDQYLSIHENWQAAMKKFIQTKHWAIGPDEVEKFISDLIASREQDQRLIADLRDKLEMTK
jgi:hypothetical protein